MTAAQRTAGLLEGWFPSAARPLPWRTNTHDPGQVRDAWGTLVAEVMLQQTQVSRVVPAWLAFMARFPTPGALARAQEEEALAAWSGLGYYRRARLLHAAALRIVAEHHGLTPTDPRSLRALPGVGRYTAGAVASIAAGAPAAIVDGNVLRVLARLHARPGAAGWAPLVRWAWAQSERLVAAASRPGVCNEAIMELGATVCTPAAPACVRCPLAGQCRARALGAPERFPAPKARAARTDLHALALVLRDASGRVLCQRRAPGGLWGGLWQAATLESAAPIDDAGAHAWARMRGAGAGVRPLGGFVWLTTHRRVRFRVWGGAGVCCLRRRAAQSAASPAAPPTRWVSPAELAQLPMGSAQRRVFELAGVGAADPRPAAAQPRGPLP